MFETARDGTASTAAPSSPSFFSLARSALVWTTAAVALAGLATLLDPIPKGLSAAYYATADWTGRAVRLTVDPTLSTDQLTSDWHGAPPPVFSAAWTGSFIALRAGRYSFSTISDDGSRVYVDGRLVVDNGGRHGPKQVTGSAALARGVHSILVEYFQDGGDLHMELLWARDGQALQAIPRWALTPRHAAFAPFAASVALRHTLVAIEWAWFAALLLAGAMLAARLGSRGRQWLVRERAWPALAWIAAGSALLNLAGVWWGLPGIDWAPDAISPALVLAGLDARFSRGWFYVYPPFHFYLLTAAFSPMLLLNWLGRVDLTRATPQLILMLVGRIVTLAQALGTVVAVYACGTRAFGRRAGLWAAAAFAVVAPFVYYAKTTNVDVPYLFWFAISLVFFLRLLEAPRTPDLVGFAVAATLSICTKDQAYGLFVLPALAIVCRMWREGGETGDPAPLRHALVDGRLAIAAATAVLLFAACQNLAFNWSGFVLHVKEITGGRSISYRMFEPTIGGRLALLGLTAELLKRSMGWPLFLVCGAGAVSAMAAPRYRRPALWLLLPVVSYYATFIDVVLFTYDRFLLPISLVLALFGGLAIDRFLSGEPRRWRYVVVAVVISYTFLYAATVDVLMLRDSRYTVERWLKANAGHDDLVGFTFPRQYYPSFADFQSAEINSIDELEWNRPMYFILDVDYAQAEPSDSAVGKLIARLQGGSAGYRLAFRFRQPAPWPWLPGAHPDLVGPRLDQQVYSTLHHINPTIEVFKRNR